MFGQRKLPFKGEQIELHGVSKYYQGRSALSDIELSVPQSGAYFVTGPSGAGKSTLLRLMALLEPPSRGEIWIEGVRINELSLAESRHIRDKMGFVFQSPYLLYDRDAFANVALPLLIKGYADSDISRRVDTTLKSLGLLDRAKDFPGTFSAGEQERLSIAQALVSRPRILFADEPTGNLDPKLSHEVMSLLCAMPLQETTVVIATHDISLLGQFPHVPILELEGGRITHNGIAEKDSPS